MTADRPVIAIHEAGHAVAALACGATISAVWVRRTARGDGWCTYGWPGPVDAGLAAAAALAGYTAQHMIGAGPQVTAAQVRRFGTDGAEAATLADQAADPRWLPALLDWTAQLLAACWPQVADLAGMLLDPPYWLTGDQVHRWWDRQKIKPPGSALTRANDDSAQRAMLRGGALSANVAGAGALKSCKITFAGVSS